MSGFKPMKNDFWDLVIFIIRELINLSSSMEVISHIQSIPEGQKTILTLGMFDGVHKGHQEIIQYLNGLSRHHNEKSCLLTFWPHPRLVLHQDFDLKLLTLHEEKIKLLEHFDLDLLYVQPFDLNFSRMSSIEFVRDFLVRKLHVHTLIIGHDHRFGRNREGDFELLQELAELYKFKVIQLDAIFENNLPISSTKIRSALIEGNLTYANEALGYCYSITGKVIHGDGIGRKLGFPTVNLEISKLKLLPKDGVYGVQLFLKGEQFYGLLNIGFRPTINQPEHRVEVYILDFDGDLYDEEIEIQLLTRIRDERKFENKDKLSDQIKKDELYFRNYIQSHGNQNL